MLFKKQTPTYTGIPETAGRCSVMSSSSSSEALSVFSTQTSGSGFFSRFNRRPYSGRITGPSESNPLPLLDSIVNDLSKDILRLQDERDLFREQSNMHKTLLDECNSELQAKELESSQLHQSISMLKTEVHALKLSCEALQRERVDLTKQANIQKKTVNKLEAENDILATCVAIHDKNAKQANKVIQWLKQQCMALTEFQEEEQ